MYKLNYNGKVFKPIRSTPNSDSSSETHFYYKQTDDIIEATYFGGNIRSGHLLGLVDTHGNINFRYHHINSENKIMSGTCRSKPEILANGKIRLHEEWLWTSGDCSEGRSIVEEL